MLHNFSLFDLLITLGIIQGIITSILLFRSKRNAYSNQFLALAVLSFCFLCIKTLIHTLNLWEMSSFRYLPIGVELLIGPLIYLYVRSLINPTFHFSKKSWLHFVPFLISQAYAFIVYYLTLRVPNSLQKDTIAYSLHFDTVKTFEEYLILISVIIYLAISYKELNTYKKWLHNSISDNTYPSFNWLNNIFRLSLLLGLFLLTNNLLDVFFKLRETHMFHWDALMVYVAFLIYYLGLSGYLQPDYTFIGNRKRSKKKNQEISEVKKRTISKELKQAMEIDKVFLNPTLTIDKLASIVNTSSKNLSRVINQEYKKSFRDFINEYRINEVKHKLKSKDYKSKSILGIALECGFNSEASFYRVFKKVTQKSPKDFIQENK